MFSNRLPTPLELENAIATVEDIVMPLALRRSASTRLVTADPPALRLCELAGLAAVPHNTPSLATAAETLFNEMVDVSQGRPSPDLHCWMSPCAATC